MRRRTYLGLAAVGVIAGCVGDETDAQAGGDGPSGDEQSTGGEQSGDEQSDEEHTPDSVHFDQRWTATLDTTVNMRHDVALGDDALFVGHHGGLIALEIDDGEQRWLREDWSEYQGVHADENGVVAVTNEELVTLATESGETAWSESVEGLQGGLIGSGATPHLVFFSNNDGTRVYERNGGDELATFDVTNSDVATSEDVAIMTPAFEAIALDPETGEELWRADSDIGPGGAIGDDVLVGFDTGDLEEGAIIGQDATNGERLWEETIDHPNTAFVDVAITDGVAVFIPHHQDRPTLYAVDVVDGTALWTESLGDTNQLFRPPAVDDGLVVAETEDEARAFDATSGETLATKDRPFSTRAGVATDGIFLEWEGDDLTAYDL